MTTCPCCSGKKYATCCGPFINGTAIPSTPEQLMRSRYTAYTEANTDYINQTMTSPANDDFNPEEAKAWAKTVRWHKLEVLNTTVDGPHGTVEFIAHFDENNKRQTLHEISQFKLKDNHWLYTDGEIPHEEGCGCH